MIISSLADFLNLEDLSLATGAGTLTRKSFLPDLKIDHSQKYPSNYSQNIRNWESKSDVRNKFNQNAILRQNYSFDNGNNSDIVCENHFLGQMCQQIQNMSLMQDKKLKDITGLFQTQTQTHIPQQISYMIPSPQSTHYKL